MDGLVVTDELHALAEQVERAALAELHDAAPPALRERLGLRAETVDGAFVSIAPGAPSIVVNRATGLGSERPASRDAIPAIRTLYEEAGVARYFVQVGPEAEPAALRDRLAEAGFTPARRWMKFARAADEPAPHVNTDLTVAQIGAAHAEAFGAVIAEGFDLGAGGGALLESLVGRPGWYPFMSFDGDEPAGAGALFVDARTGCGWLDWGATWHAHRGRGAQSAVLAARIEKARALGCRALFTTTGEWVEGDPQHSYNNIEKTGFRPLFLQENWQPMR